MQPLLHTRGGSLHGLYHELLMMLTVAEKSFCASDNIRSMCKKGQIGRLISCTILVLHIFIVWRTFVLVVVQMADAHARSYLQIL